MTLKTPIQRACELAGGQSALARLLSKPEAPVSPQVVQHWCRNNRVPAERVLAVEAAVEGQVTRYDLRPDLYPRGGIGSTAAVAAAAG